MTQDLKMIHSVTVKLEQALHQINKMLSDYLINRKSGMPQQANNENKASNNNKKRSNKKDTNGIKLKKPPGPFILFSSQQREVIRKSYPDMKMPEVSENLGKIWQNLSTEDKQPYVEKSQKLLDKFYDEHPEQRPKKKNTNQ